MRSQHQGLLTVFFADKIEWECLADEGFPARYEHASFIVHSPKEDKDELYVFAGAQPDGPVNDMWKSPLRKLLCSWRE